MQVSGDCSALAPEEAVLLTRGFFALGTRFLEQSQALVDEADAGWDSHNPKLVFVLEKGAGEVWEASDRVRGALQWDTTSVTALVAIQGCLLALTALQGLG